jgi:UDP-2,3-diacylglucosamine pyrophosphatase LpxH
VRLNAKPLWAPGWNGEEGGRDPLSAVAAPSQFEFGSQNRVAYRSVWLSDLHLGTRACKASALLDFLRRHIAENLYLVGDIVDGWNQGRSWFWDVVQSEVAQEIGRWGRAGAQVVFLPGNHDEAQGGLLEGLFGRVTLKPDLIHTTAEGRRMLIMHGHQFDNSLSSSRWLSKMGSPAYSWSLKVADWYNREFLNFDEQPFAGYLKRPLSRMIGYLTETKIDERAMLRAVRAARADGIVCGHTHRVEQRLIGSIWYINDGDWMHHCSALVEHYDGALRLMQFPPPVASTERASSIGPTAVLAEAW